MKKYILTFLTLLALPAYSLDTQKYAYKVGGEAVTALGSVMCAATYFFTSTRTGLHCARKLLKKRDIILKKDTPLFTTDFKCLMYGIGLGIFGFGVYLKS